mmetsp:Transcript_7087/g.29251  ORF Transcript_7087/g.29251 Transcript_7087/m.29251 type:complete len:201 (-) Transcript_7087:377-979(-)
MHADRRGVLVRGDATNRGGERRVRPSSRGVRAAFHGHHVVPPLLDQQTHDAFVPVADEVAAHLLLLLALAYELFLRQALQVARRALHHRRDGRQPELPAVHLRVRATWAHAPRRRRRHRRFVRHAALAALAREHSRVSSASAALALARGLADAHVLEPQADAVRRVGRPGRLKLHRRHQARHLRQAALDEVVERRDVIHD